MKTLFCAAVLVFAASANAAVVVRDAAHQPTSQSTPQAGVPQRSVSSTELCASQAEFFGKTIAMRQAGMGTGQVYTLASQSYASAYHEQPSAARNEWTKNLIQRVYGNRDFLFLDPQAAADEYSGQCNMDPKKFLLKD